MELGEHIPTSDESEGHDEFGLGQHLATSDSEQECLKRPKTHCGSASSTSQVKSGFSLDVSAKMLARKNQGQMAGAAWDLSDMVQIGGIAGSAATHSSDITMLNALVEKSCLTCNRECFRQFRGNMGLIADFRREFRELKPTGQDMFVADMLSSKEFTQKQSHPSIHLDEKVLGEECVSSDNDTTQRGAQVPHNARHRPSKGNETLWSFQGRRVCGKALPKLIGIGEKRWRRLKRGAPDRRRGKRPRGPAGQPLMERQGKKPTHILKVATFLWHLWDSTAEGMPNRKIKQGRREQRWTATFSRTKTQTQPPPAIDQGSDGEDDQASDMVISDDSDRSLENDDNQAVARALQAVVEADNIHAKLRVFVHDIPKRWLPPGKKIWYYYQYLAHCDEVGDPRPHYSVFFKIWKRYFDDKIGFRKVNEHARCSTCEGYKREHSQAQTISVRLQIAAKYADHLQLTWQDRQVYWNARHLSRLCLRQMLQGGSIAKAFVGSSIMCLFIDGMDQSKFFVPRDPKFVKTKTSETLIRPHLHVAGTWIHGAGLHLTVADPDMPKNSNHNQECIARALNEFYAKAGSLPLNLHIQSDNCSREGKNQYLVVFASVLVSLSVFKSVSLEFMTKGP